MTMSKGTDSDVSRASTRPGRMVDEAEIQELIASTTATLKKLYALRDAKISIRII